jgi:hypothetical protein
MTPPCRISNPVSLDTGRGERKRPQINPRLRERNSLPRVEARDEGPTHDVCAFRGRTSVVESPDGRNLP